MSSLLDVLHKRPSRAELAAAAEAAALADSVDEPGRDVELSLASEGDSAPADLTGRPLAPEGAATNGLPAADAVGATRAPARRWTDPEQAQPVPPPVAVPAIARQYAGGLHAGPVVVVGMAAALCAAWLAWSYYATPVAGEAVVDDGDPGTGGLAVASVPAGSAAAPVAATSKLARRRPAPAPRAGVPTDEGATLAWYEQPALPVNEGEVAAVAPAPEIRITRGSTADPVFERLDAAYQALVAGDAAAAEAAYREVLATDTASVDALLGLGTLTARDGRAAEARDLYRRVQQLDPKNATAAAALSVLPGDAGAAAGESHLKGMLAEQPDSAGLHFALALRFVAEDRWPDAQAEFFEAVRYAPRNADYAFNLAVSLDRLGQVQPAAGYYQRAIELATGSQQFDVATARSRLAILRGQEG